MLIFFTSELENDRRTAETFSFNGNFYNALYEELA